MVPSTHDAASDAPRAPKVLVVDDDRGVRTVIVLMLEQFGFAVLAAEDGTQAVRLFEAHADELTAVVLDVSLPDIPGTQVFRELQAICPHVPVVLTSGRSDPEATAHFIRQGVAAFLGKPFSPQRLVETLERVSAV